jgi:signal transduction histidine kinase
VPVADILHEEQTKEVFARADRILAGEIHGSIRERLFRKKDGGWITMEAAAMRIELDGAPAILLFARDVSTRKRVEAQLLLRDRMAALGTLAAGVAHEVNNPLAYVINNLDMLAGLLPRLEQDVRAGAEPASMLERIAAVAETSRIAREGCEQVRLIVADLKLLSRAGEDTSRLVDVRPVLDASINIARRTIAGRAQVERDFAEVPPVRANESRLGQVFLNLLMNAAHAIPEGDPAQNRIRVSTAQDELGRVIVEVADTGVGMEPELVARIFDPFFTTKSPDMGSGLGLSICQGIVSSLNGEIGVTSSPGRGSTFRVVLPV